MRHRRRTMVAAGLCAAVALTLSPVVRPLTAHAFTTATHRAMPQVPAHSYVGKPLRIVSLVPKVGTATDATTITSRLIWFGYSLPRSLWYHALSNDYGLGFEGTSHGIRVGDMPKLSNNPTLDDYITYVGTKAKNNGVAVNTAYRTEYAIYIPCTGNQRISGNNASACGNGFHVGLQPSAGVNNFSSGDSLDIELVNNYSSINAAPYNAAFDFVTRVMSHEVIEGTTNPNADGYHLRTAHPNAPWLDASPWVELQDSGSTEVGDMGRLFGNVIHENFSAPDPSHSTTYAYQRIYADSAGAANGDPLLPSSLLPYYSVSTGQDWFHKSKTQTISIPVTGWSVSAVANWTLSFNQLAWSGESDGSEPSSHCGVVFANGSSSVTINNGGIAHLHISALPNTVAGDWCVLELISARASDPGNGGDLHHSWVIGFHFTA